MCKCAPFERAFTREKAFSGWGLLQFYYCKKIESLWKKGVQKKVIIYKRKNGT